MVHVFWGVKGNSKMYGEISLVHGKDLWAFKPYFVDDPRFTADERAQIECRVEERTALLNLTQRLLGKTKY